MFKVGQKVNVKSRVGYMTIKTSAMIISTDHMTYGCYTIELEDGTRKDVEHFHVEEYREPKIVEEEKMVLCSCGHYCYKSQVMNGYFGTICPKCI